jgi:xylan 1,4-beta-xylosidase
VNNEAGEAKADWDERIGRRSGALDGTTAEPEVLRLAAPASLRAAPGRGQVTLDWDPVKGAAGYLVHRAATRDGPFEPVDHLGGDVLAVPHAPYCDTTGEPGAQVWYAVAAVADVSMVGELSEPVAAIPLVAGSDSLPAVSVTVDAGGTAGPLARPWRPMIGSEHPGHQLCEETTGGRPVGAELLEALAIVRDAVGVQTVRAHGILHDDLGVYREVDGHPRHDFTGVDRVYDQLMELGLRPVVELSFMPRDLAADPDKTVFAYGAGISPPKDWDRWAELIRALVAHLVHRYGLDEVRDRWSFEVWNEANLEVFWSGTPAEFLRLYDVTAQAVKEVHPELRVGGPSSAAAGWVTELLAHTAESGAPVDFVSTHTYGSPPLDLRPILDRHGRGDADIWWTEWSATPTHFHPVGDSVFAAAFLARGMRSAAGRIDALSHWVASDHFEELGRPPKLLHGGFGLLTVGNLRKPRFWALAMLERLGSAELPATLAGDGGGSLVEGWGGRDPDGRIALALWNGTLDQSKIDRAPMLDRRVTVRFDGLEERGYELRHWRVDATHSNVAARWAALSGQPSGGTADWPDEAGWEALREADTLEELEPARPVTAAEGTLEVTFDLPNPAVSLIELVPAPVDIHTAP